MKLTLTVNGREEIVEAAADETLLDVIRDRLSLTATKDGCREGECGACTVLIDGSPVNSCIYSAVAAEGRNIETVESFGAETLSRVQSALIKNNGIQCGFCTPGFVAMITALLRKHADPSEDEIKKFLSGNICRCTGYSTIVAAVREAAMSVSEGA